MGVLRVAILAGFSAILRKAIANNEFILYYQPIVDLKEDNTIVGVEALIRWQHPSRGLILPGEFIELAEITGQITAIDEWVLIEASRQIRLWNKQRKERGQSPLFCFCNLSTLELGNRAFGNRLVSLIRSGEIEPEFVGLEITETAAIGSLAESEILQQLAGLKIRLAIDDFGTGYSNLIRLRELSGYLDELKIDRVFVRDIETMDNARQLCQAAIGLAKTFKLKAIAEGIETPGQLAVLSEMNVDYGQGYYFARPTLPEEIAVV